jgi:putative tryptophan/tyrosine transport system substrate-binding protein
MRFDLQRREFITLLSSASAAPSLLWPLAARAQQPTMPVIGLLGSETADIFAGRLRAFRQGLSETGYVEGQNVAIEYRWAMGQYDHLPALAADLVRREVTVIATIGGTPAALAAKASSTSIPIVFQIGIDPIQIGLVGSLARPGGNLTGVTTLNLEVVPKRVELLHELIPTASAIALLVNPTSPALAETSTRDAQAAARTLGLELHVLHASTERDFEVVFATLVQRPAGGLVIAPDAFFNSHMEQLAALALRHAVPACYQFREFAAAGGLMSYGGDVTDTYRQAGIYSGRILKGEKPAELPVQQSAKVELIINLKTAKGLGLTVPTALLVRADEVIE